MALSPCKNYLASCALDDIVKIVDVSNLADRPLDGTFDLEAYERSIEDKLKPNHGKVLFDAGDSDSDN